jgi:hypothetical protein
MMTVRRSKKLNAINVIDIQNDARSLPKRVNKSIFQIFIDTMTRDKIKE